MSAVDPRSDNYVAFSCNPGNNGTNGTTGGSGNPNDTNKSASGSSLPLGPIIGGAVGGSALIIFAIAFFWWMRHKKQKLAAEGSEYPAQALSPGMTHLGYFPGDFRAGSDWPKAPDPRQHEGYHSGAASRYGDGPNSPYSDAGGPVHWSPSAPGPPNRGLYEVPG